MTSISTKTQETRHCDRPAARFGCSERRGGAEFEFRLLVEGGKERGADARPLSALSERLTVIANLPLLRRSRHTHRTALGFPPIVDRQYLPKHSGIRTAGKRGEGRATPPSCRNMNSGKLPCGYHLYSNQRFHHLPNNGISL